MELAIKAAHTNKDVDVFAQGSCFRVTASFEGHHKDCPVKLCEKSSIIHKAYTVIIYFQIIRIALQMLICSIHNNLSGLHDMTYSHFRAQLEL
jgi:hypothetical protein